jgi:hydroxymethylpyrimidine/phosphomethylpyrimidine kinase
MTIPIALSIAGSDPSGGAGLQADLKVFHQHGVYGCAAATLLTVQDSRGVHDVHLIPPAIVEAQIQAVLEDFPVRVIKTGAIGSLSIAQAVASAIAGHKLSLVIDPVMVSSSGRPLLALDDAREVAERLFKHATLITPNLDEADFLLGWRPETAEQLEKAAMELHQHWGCAVLLKGGHLAGNPIDVFCHHGKTHVLSGQRVHTRHTHGTGCVLASAIASHIAHGMNLLPAIEKARQFVHQALTTAPGFGQGHGPMNLFVTP